MQAGTFCIESKNLQNEFQMLKDFAANEETNANEKDTNESQ